MREASFLFHFALLPLKAETLYSQKTHFAVSCWESGTESISVVPLFFFCFLFFVLVKPEPGASEEVFTCTS